MLSAIRAFSPFSISIWYNGYHSFAIQQKRVPMNTIVHGNFTIATTTHTELVDITAEVNRVIQEHKIANGVCFLFNPHTTAGLTINEGADPDVQKDIIAGFKEIAPLQLDYMHMEGNSPSHIMASLMGSNLTVSILNNSCRLGTWQKIFFCEFDGPRTRQVNYTILIGQD